jgi:HD superfamily phosphodiesterase
MADIEKLEQLVRKLYEEKNPNRDRWCDWMYKNHVMSVVDYTENLAKRFKVSIDLCRAAALLHDIADAEMTRGDPKYEWSSLKIADHFLRQANFSGNERDDILRDALPFHSCHGDERPNTPVGKILSTADALSHLNTNFYGYFNSVLAQKKSREALRQEAGERLARDFQNKIAFDEIREEVRERYEELLHQYV